MLTMKTRVLFNHLFSLQLFIIWALGTYGSWLTNATEMLYPIFLGSFFMGNTRFCWIQNTTSNLLF